MKKRIKIFILLLIVFVVSGCSVQYNLTINEDSSVSEEVIASEKTNRLESKTRLKGEDAYNYLYNMFKRPNEDISISFKEKNNITYGVANTTHNSIEEYSSKFSSDIFEKVEITKDEDTVTITANQKSPISSNSTSSYIYDDITINVTLPFTVIENNADKINKNTFTWNIKKDSNVKEIKLTYRKKSLANRANININNKEYSIKYEYIIIGVIVLSIVVIIIYVVIKNKKNNTL